MRDARSEFVVELRARARARRARLAFPEGDDPRVLQAVSEGVRAELFHPVLLGPPDVIRAGAETAGVDLDAITILDDEDPDRIERYAPLLHERRKDRGVTEHEARRFVRDRLVQAALMLDAGEVDGSVAGCVRTTGDVILAALWGVGVAEGISSVSSSFYMDFDRNHPHGPAVLTFTDPGVVPEPTPHELAEIAMAAARARIKVVGDEPRVAFLSYSTMGSADGPAVEKVREAVERFRALMPGVTAEGELQVDAALSRDVALRKAPDAILRGDANVLVFPDLNAANIGYKLVQYLAGAHAYGPILQGLRLPCNDLSRGAVADDIVSVACITSVLAEPR